MKIEKCAGLVVLALMLSTVSAEAQMTEEEKAYLNEKKFGPTQTFMVTSKARAIWIADWTLDLFLDRHSSHWDDRANMEYGLDFTMRTPNQYQLVFGLSWADLSMPEDWWLEKDDPPRKADWTKIDTQLLVLDATYLVEWEISDVFAIYAGGGLGVGLFLGDETKRDPAREPAGSSCLDALTMTTDPNVLDGPPCIVDGQPQLDPTEEPESVGVPQVLPWLNLTVGTQFTIAKHGILKIESGFKGYWFSGVSLGGQWW